MLTRVGLFLQPRHPVPIPSPDAQFYPETVSQKKQRADKDAPRAHGAEEEKAAPKYREAAGQRRLTCKETGSAGTSQTREQRRENAEKTVTNHQQRVNMNVTDDSSQATQRQ